MASRRCAWPSMSPGRTVRAERSMTVASFGTRPETEARGPTSLILPSSMRIPRCSRRTPALTSRRRPAFTSVGGPARSGVVTRRTASEDFVNRIIRAGALRGAGDAHGTGDARSPEAAVAVGILREVLLVVVLRVIELGSGQNLGRDGAVTRGGKLPLECRFRGLGRRALRVVQRIDAGAVLRASVVPLPHALRRIVVFPEQFQQRVVRDHRGIEDDENHLAVPRAARADLAIRGVRREARGVADGGREHAALLPEFLLGSPEAAHAEKRALHPFGKGRFERV